MGLNVDGTRFLLHAHKLGVDFSTTATIGRQGMHINAEQLRVNLNNFGFHTSLADAQKLIDEENGFSEPFLRLLGAKEIKSFDASSFEGASYARDFNLPIEKELHGKFSVVLDSGTLEHIFNFPQAISNCMNLVKEGGYFLGNTPTNGHSGHGFYQFSPELFYRVLGPDNGFVVLDMKASDQTGYNWHDLPDPAIVKHRVLVQSQNEAILLVIAKKTSCIPLFSAPIQQSAYIQPWKDHDDRFSFPKKG